MHFCDFLNYKGVKYWVLPITKIIKKKYKGKVYNLTVSGDHSYVTKNFTVGNCDKGGDMFSFIQEIEGVEFVEALRILAKKANVTLERRNPELENKKTKMLDIIKEATEFFEKALLESDEGEIARDYLDERGVSEDARYEFKIGYAFDDWEKLNNYLQSKDYSEEEIFQAGLTIKSEKRAGYYDRFRGRLIFPICDVHANVVGFTARKLKEDEADKTGKYINTPSTDVYDKSRVIYGLDKAKQNIKKLGATIIVEGNMDVVSTHQSGFNNVVATSGTALTEFQVDLLKRYSSNLIIAFDMDAAGAEAAKRGIDLAMQKEMNIKILTLPEDVKDPDELIKKDPALFKQAIKDSQSIMDYYFSTTLKNLDLSKVDDKKKAASALLPIISKIGESIEQTHYLQKLSELINVSEEILRKKITKTRKIEKNKKEEDEDAKDERVSSRFEKLSERIVALICMKSDDFKYFADYLDPEFIQGGDIKELYKKMINYYNENNQFIKEEFVKSNPELEKRISILTLLAEGEFSDVSEKDLQKEVMADIKDLEENYIRNRLQQIQNSIVQLEKDSNDAEVEKLSNEFNLLTQKLTNIS
ncbi:MAG: DNA primase [Patescibacteria group bacterium]